MGGSSPGSSREREDEDVDLISTYNDAILAINIIFDAAGNGSGAAVVVLQALAERLIEAAGRHSKEV